MSNSTPAARSKARTFALQGLYQMQLSGCSATDVEREYREDHDMKRVDLDYFHDLMVGVAKHRKELDDLIAPKLDRQLDELDPVESAILHIGCFELVHRIDIPFRVVINEAVELAHRFGASESHKFVNSVLDALAREHRVVELKGSG
ncbi:MAG: transcription antitermination factor NusB [Pseudomonadales bacterium]|nr:transcription antitermination factor NusB [Pseudomonadales bacterium]